VSGSTRVLKTINVLALVALSVSQSARAQQASPLFQQVGRLLQQSCALPACHGSDKPAAGLRLEASHFYRNTVNVRARTDSSFLRVTPGSPELSLLYLKLLSPDEGHYRGPRMPFSMEPLRDEQIALVREWILSFPKEEWGEPPLRTPPAAPRFFRDSSLIDLPTPESLGKDSLEFRILHRFKQSTRDAGGEELWGLDGGSWWSIQLAYGLTETLQAGLRRTNQFRDYEGFVLYAPRISGTAGRYFSGALRGGISSLRDEQAANRNRWSAEVILGYRPWKLVSFLLTSLYLSRANYEDPQDDQGTAAIGLGAEWHVTSKQSVSAEWIGQTAGVKARYQAFSLAWGVATARHAFTLLATNAQGEHTDLVAPGGDLDIEKGYFRLGFNISRSFTPH
jgi:uncharacterized beta barrel domain-containing protein DUF5777